MKKLLMGIFGLTLLLPVFVFAEEDNPTPDIGSVEEGENSTSQTVTIGKVETPVYEVYMVWQDPRFDWTYNKKTGAYNWTPAVRCEKYYGGIEIDGKILSPDELIAIGYLYTDDTCQTVTEDYQEETTYYYIYEPEKFMFGIEDMSQEGRIIPSVSWTSSTKYSYIDGKFSYSEEVPVCSVLDEDLYVEALINNYDIYNDSSCYNLIEYPDTEYIENTYYGFLSTYVMTELTTEELPDSARYSAMGDGNFFVPESKLDLTNKHFYYVELKLENKETPTETPKSGDTLGTITISIRAAE